MSMVDTLSTQDSQFWGNKAKYRFFHFISLSLMVLTIDIESSKIDCLRFVVCPLLAQLITGFFSSFSAAAIHSTNEANKAGRTCH
jgi:hypothetical protein